MSSQIGHNHTSNSNSNNQALLQQKLKDDKDKQRDSEGRKCPCNLRDMVFCSPQALEGHGQSHPKRRRLEQRLAMEISLGVRDHQPPKERYYDRAPQPTPQLESIINGLSRWRGVSRCLPDEQEQQYSILPPLNYRLLVNDHGSSVTFTKPYINQLEKPWVVSGGSTSRASAVAPSMVVLPSESTDEIEGWSLDLKL